MIGGPSPRAWKRRLVPVWNALVHRGRRLSEYAGAVACGRIGRCTVCGRMALWLYRPRVIALELRHRWRLTPRLAYALARKETLDCSRCGAKLRARRIASVVLELYPAGDASSRARSIRAWAASKAARSLNVAEINRVDGLHEALRALPTLAYSDFQPNAPRGEVVCGVRHEDLTRLTYPDDAFDLVITSESLEHVPDLDAALSEIRRVLKPGGRHVFTIPRLPGVPRTFSRLDATGRPIPKVVEIRHPGGDWGYPVYTEFGDDVFDLLSAAGFETDERFGPVSMDDLAQVYITRKPTA